MKEGKAKGSELVIYPDGTLYHINLKKADNVPPNLFFVGSAGRVDSIAKQFDEITLKTRNESRPEFYLAAGTYKGVPMAAFSCGIGVDNIEIAINEFHALFEYDHETGEWEDKRDDINIIRVGSCGTSLPEIPVGAIGISEYAIGLDNLGAYYPARQQDPETEKIEEKFLKTQVGKVNTLSYASQATPKVAEALHKTAKAAGEKEPNLALGITTSSPGFFAPEGRKIGRMKTALTFEQFLSTVQDFEHSGRRIINHEMEASALFRQGYEILGYNVGVICLVLDNLSTDEFVEKAYADKRMDECINIALEAMVGLAQK